MWPQAADSRERTIEGSNVARWDQMKKTYSSDEAGSVARALGLDFARSKFNFQQFHAGLNVEAEHGKVDPETNVTDDDPVTTGKIALAHLNEIPDYYSRLTKMEADAAPSTTP
jgi:hypothetical protein